MQLSTILHSRRSPASASLLVLAVSTILSQALAQGDNNLPTLATSADSNNGLPTAAATSGLDSASASATDSPSDTDSDTSATTTLGRSSSADGSMPTLSSSSSDDNGLPTLAGGFNYPPPSVPPTADAPYMQRSSLPEGTIFIAVGAAIGFVTLAIFAWRMLVAWSINRSVKRAALASYATDTKALLSGRGSPGHKTSTYHDHRNLSPTFNEKVRSSSHPISKGTTPNSSLFFSPTAGAGMHTNAAMAQRNSGYLPAGYYASGGVSPGPQNQVGGNSRPKSSGTYGNAPSRSPINDPSPPDSPLYPPSRAGLSTVGHSGAYESSSTLNLGSTTGGRAPSTYLDDLMNAPVPPQHRHEARHGRVSEDRQRRRYRD